MSLCLELSSSMANLPIVEGSRNMTKIHCHEAKQVLLDVLRVKVMDTKFINVLIRMHVP